MRCSALACGVLFSAGCDARLPARIERFSPTVAWTTLGSEGSVTAIASSWTGRTFADVGVFDGVLDSTGFGRLTFGPRLERNALFELNQGVSLEDWWCEIGGVTYEAIGGSGWVSVDLDESSAHIVIEDLVLVGVSAYYDSGYNVDNLPADTTYLEIPSLDWTFPIESRRNYFDCPPDLG